MRIFKGLENIHSVIDRHEAEWRKEQGDVSERLSPISIEENVRRVDSLPTGFWAETLSQSRPLKLPGLNPKL